VGGQGDLLVGGQHGILVREQTSLINVPQSREFVQATCPVHMQHRLSLALLLLQSSGLGIYGGT
jgi:hypothetical protein